MKVITVDFDDTLFIDPVVMAFSLWVPEGVDTLPIVKVHDFVKEKAKEGCEIHVVSFRMEKHKQEMIDLCKLYELPIKTFTCTEGKAKTSVLKALRSDLHIDDNVEVLVLAGQAGIEGLLVDYGQEDTNSTAKLFKKI
jgi:hypothetical protein